jgi:hypothetical protein
MDLVLGLANLCITTAGSKSITDFIPKFFVVSITNGIYDVRDPVNLRPKISGSKIIITDDFISRLKKYYGEKMLIFTNDDGFDGMVELKIKDWRTHDILDVDDMIGVVNEALEEVIG